MRFPIIAGPLRGCWWLATSRGKVLRILNGTYEPAQTRLFTTTVRPGDTVLDIGAHAGYYALLASVLTGEHGTVWAFEPDARNFAFLEKHARINHRSNIRPQPLAVSDTNGMARFGVGTGSGTGHLTDTGTLEVQTVRLDDFCQSRSIRPAVVKIDVEGAEGAVLDGARELLSAARPVLFLSTHGPDVHRYCLRLLSELGYGLQPIVGSNVERATELLCSPEERPRASN